MSDTEWKAEVAAANECIEAKNRSDALFEKFVSQLPTINPAEVLRDLAPRYFKASGLQMADDFDIQCDKLADFLNVELPDQIPPRML